MGSDERKLMYIKRKKAHQEIGISYNSILISSSENFMALDTRSGIVKFEQRTSQVVSNGLHDSKETTKIVKVEKILTVNHLSYPIEVRGSSLMNDILLSHTHRHSFHVGKVLQVRYTLP